MDRRALASGFKAATPICIGYLVLGLPCGILGAAAGMDVWQVLILSLLMYSGSGQYMIPNLYLAATPIASLVMAVSLVSSRQLLHSSAFVPFTEGARKGPVAWFAATVTDESFGVNLARFQGGSWTLSQAQAVNTCCHTAWILANVLGVVLGEWLVIDTAVASFAMTSLFICLLMMQRFNHAKVLAALVSIAAVVICKLVGLTGPAILIAAVAGVTAGVVSSHLHPQSKNASEKGGR